MSYSCSILTLCMMPPAAITTEESNDDDKSFTAKVVQVVSGDTIVAIDGNNRTRRLVLASIQAPRYAIPALCTDCTCSRSVAPLTFRCA